MKKGYTLLELLVVIAILAILATVGFVSYRGIQKAARDTMRKQNLHNLKLALEQYKAVNGTYPSTGGAWWGESTNGGSRTQTYIPGLVPDYMKSLPNDQLVNRAVGGCCPATGDTGYWYISNGTDYKVSAWCSVEGDMGTGATNPYYSPGSPTCEWIVYSDDGVNLD